MYWLDQGQFLLPGISLRQSTRDAIVLRLELQTCGMKLSQPGWHVVVGVCEHVDQNETGLQ